MSAPPAPPKITDRDPMTDFERRDVTLLGDTSPGALSDIQMKSLPNGGVLGLPNEVVMSADGENYDARGIAPDVRTTVFDPARPLSGYTRTLAAAASLAASMAVR